MQSIINKQRPPGDLPAGAAVLSSLSERQPPAPLVEKKML